MATPSPLRALVLVLALLVRPLGAGGAGEPTAPSPVLAAVSTPFPATALLAVPTAGWGWDAPPAGWNASAITIRHAVRAWRASHTLAGPPPRPPAGSSSPPSPPPSPPLPPCLVAYAPSSLHHDGTGGMHCSMPLADRNVALNGGSRPLTKASGGAATHPERAVDFAATGTWYESEAGDGGQWIDADLGDTFRVVEIRARWTEEAYAPTGVRLSYGRRDVAVNDVNDPGYVTRAVLGATGVTGGTGLDVGRDDPVVRSTGGSDPGDPVTHSWRAPKLNPNDAGYDPSMPFDGAGVDARTIRVEALGVNAGGSRRVRCANLEVFGYAPGEIPPSPPPASSSPPPPPPVASPPPPDPDDVVAGCDEGDGYVTSATRAATGDELGGDDDDEAGLAAKVWRFAGDPISFRSRAVLVAWTCAPGFAPSRTVTYAIRTAANAPNFALVSPGESAKRVDVVNDNDNDDNDDTNNTNNTVVAPASLEFAVDPSELAATGATVLVSVRDVADPDRAPTPDCDSRGDDDDALAARGITRLRLRAAASPDSSPVTPPATSIPLATLGTVRVVAVTCPGDDSDSGDGSDPGDGLDPSGLNAAIVRVESPTSAGGANAPAEVSASLALSGGGIGVDEARSVNAQERIRRAVAWSLRRDGGSYGEESVAEDVFLRSIRSIRSTGGGDGGRRRRALLLAGSASDVEYISLDVVLSVRDALEADAAADALESIVASNSLKNSLALEQIVVSVNLGSSPAVRYSEADAANCSLVLGEVGRCETSEDAEGGGGEGGRGCPSLSGDLDVGPPASPAPCVTINGTDTAFFRDANANANDTFLNETFLAALWSGLNRTLNRALYDAKTTTSNGTDVGVSESGSFGEFDFPKASPAVAAGCRRWRNVSVAVPTGRFGACVVDVPSTRARGAVIAAAWEPCPVLEVEALPIDSNPADRRAYCPAPDGPGGDGWFDPRVAVAFAVAIGGVVLVAAPVVWVRRRRREMDARGMAVDWDAMEAESMTDPRRRARLESLGLWPGGVGRSARLGGTDGGRRGKGEGPGRDGFVRLGSRL